jgi:hypothetical protein
MGKVDMVIGEIFMSRDFLKVFDFSNFLTTMDVMFTVCQPRIKSGIFNVLAPFRYS